jgi:hypothetical protein
MMTLDDPRRERLLDMELIRENQYRGVHKMRMILLLEMHWFGNADKPDFCKNLHMDLLVEEERLAKELAEIRKTLWEKSNG